jgi:hypothetical protein
VKLKKKQGRGIILSTASVAPNCPFVEEVHSDERYVRGFIPISKLCDDVRGAASCLELFTRQDDVTTQ